MKKEWVITEISTVIKKVEVKADNYDEVEKMFDDQYHELDWYVDEELFDDYEIEEIEWWMI